MRPRWLPRYPIGSCVCRFHAAYRVPPRADPGKEAEEIENRSLINNPTRGGSIMRRAAISVLAAFVTSLLLLQPGIGAAPFSLFGAATPVKTGAPPNPWAVQLISNTGNGTAADDFGGIAFQDSNDSLTFAGLYGLSADYQVVTGDCGGGGPRTTTEPAPSAHTAGRQATPPTPALLPKPAPPLVSSLVAVAGHLAA